MDERQKILANAKRLHDRLARMALPVTPKEAAALLDVDVRTVTNWVWSRKLGVRIGNRQVLFVKAWGETSGYSADPSYAPGGPEADPSVKALKNGKMKSFHGLVEGGGSSGPVVF